MPEKKKCGKCQTPSVSIYWIISCRRSEQLENIFSKYDLSSTASDWNSLASLFSYWNGRIYFQPTGCFFFSSIILKFRNCIWQKPELSWQSRHATVCWRRKQNDKLFTNGLINVSTYIQVISNDCHFNGSKILCVPYGAAKVLILRK